MCVCVLFRRLFNRTVILFDRPVKHDVSPRRIRAFFNRRTKRNNNKLNGVHARCPMSTPVSLLRRGLPSPAESSPRCIIRKREPASGGGDTHTRVRRASVLIKKNKKIYYYYLFWSGENGTRIKHVTTPRPASVPRTSSTVVLVATKTIV